MTINYVLLDLIADSNRRVHALLGEIYFIKAAWERSQAA